MSECMTDSDDMAASYRPTKAKRKNRNKKHKRDGPWKPPIHGSYETMGLTKTADNPIMRPHGFRRNGDIRKIKETCLLSRLRRLAILNDCNPKMMVCITVYNEVEVELKLTLSGVI